MAGGTDGGERACLDLPDAFARNREPSTDFFKRQFAVHPQSVAEAQNLSLARFEGRQGPLDLFRELALNRVFLR
jgi:hypothetical protein